MAGDSLNRIGYALFQDVDHGKHGFSIINSNLSSRQRRVFFRDTPNSPAMGLVFGRGFLALPGDAGGISPEQSQVVIFTVFLIEEMDNHVDEINDGPAALPGTGAAEDGEIVLFAEVFQFTGDGTDLLFAGAGADHEVAGDGAAFGQFEDDDITAMAVMGEAGDLAGKFTAGQEALLAGGNGAGGMVGLFCHRSPVYTLR